MSKTYRLFVGVCSGETMSGSFAFTNVSWHFTGWDGTSRPWRWTTACHMCFFYRTGVLGQYSCTFWCHRLCAYTAQLEIRGKETARNGRWLQTKKSDVLLFQVHHLFFKWKIMRKLIHTAFFMKFEFRKSEVLVFQVHHAFSFHVKCYAKIKSILIFSRNLTESVCRKKLPY